MENGTLSNVSLSTIWWLNFWTWNSLVIGCWPVMSCIINEWPLWHATTVHCFLKWQPCHFPVMAQCFVVLIYLNVSQKRCWLFYPFVICNSNSPAVSFIYSLFQLIFLFYWGWPSFGFKQFMMLFALLMVLVTWGPHCSLESKTIPSTLIWFLVSIICLLIFVRMCVVIKCNFKNLLKTAISCNVIIACFDNRANKLDMKKHYQLLLQI